MFHFSDKFMKDYAPYTVELKCLFVALEYQNVRKNTKSIFALDNLWDGLGALTVINPDLKYFYGKMTMYPSYIRRGRDMILYFLKKHFDDKEHLIVPLKLLKIETESELAKIFNKDDFREDYRIPNREVRNLGYNIPPLVNAYMNLSPTMKLFGTAITNYGFGDVEETGILIVVDEILEEKRVRHINSFIKEHPSRLQDNQWGQQKSSKEKDTK